jgi:hypothetical protein
MKRASITPSRKKQRLIDPFVGALVNIGKNGRQPKAVDVFFTHGEPTLLLFIRCVACRSRDAFYLEAVDAEVAHLFSSLPRGPDNAPVVHFKADGKNNWVSHVCRDCESVTYSYKRLFMLNSVAKNILSALPQPIFEEVWNHVGFEPLIN